MSETTKCPYCAEDILVEAKKCKHCGEWIEQKSLVTKVSQIKLADSKDRPIQCPKCNSRKTKFIHNRSSSKRWAIWTGIASLILIAAQPFGMVFGLCCLGFIFMSFAKEYNCTDCKHKWNVSEKKKKETPQEVTNKQTYVTSLSLIIGIALLISLKSYALLFLPIFMISSIILVIGYFKGSLKLFRLHTRRNAKLACFVSFILLFTSMLLTAIYN